MTRAILIGLATALLLSTLGCDSTDPADPEFLGRYELVSVGGFLVPTSPDSEVGEITSGFIQANSDGSGVLSVDGSPLPFTYLQDANAINVTFEESALGTSIGQVSGDEVTIGLVDFTWLFRR